MATGFRAPLAAKLAGLNYRKLDYYARTGLVRSSVAAASGYGSRRLYSFADVVALRMVRELRDQGLTLRRIRKAVEALRRDWPKAGDLGTGARLVTDGKGAWLALDAERLVDLLDNSGQVEWRAVVNVGRLAAHVRSDLAKISEAA